MEQLKGQPRLPKFAAPKRYDIRLKPDLTACKFAGLVAIDLDIVSETKFIVLNAAELSIIAGTVSFTPKESSQVFEPCKVDLVEEDEILVLEFRQKLPIGFGVLVIGFEGTLNDKMKGFYRSKYEINGEEKNMAVTQFEPADARRCFPCWDEPACKATFTITLDVPSELVALSNMPIIDEKVDGPTKTVFYQESPIMSTYLVAVVVGLFDYLEDHTSDGIKVRVYTQVGKEKQGKFALDVAVKTLELYKEYFAVPYPLPKLDMITIPDFAAGAMENYGLVTYREAALLYDEQNSAAAHKLNVAIAVAHELAHQWFGNLVSYLATDSLFPEWKVWMQFLEESIDGLRLDGLAESHPIEIDEIFDAISYCKGAAVIRMLHSYLGAECFQKSLAAYIKKHACSNAKTEDLWASLEEGSGEPVNRLMNLWTKQKGYPVVSVKIKDEKLEFEQMQFLSNGTQGDGQWIVPITFCFGSYEACKNFLLQERSSSINLDGVSSWIKINVDQTGFYRVKYDEDLAAKLRFAIESKMLSPTDRLGILDDSYALCMARQLPLTSLLTLISAYREELEYTVLSNLISISHKVGRIAADATPELMDYIKQFLVSLFQKLGREPKQGESHLDAMLRGQILTALIVFGHEETQKEGRSRFYAFLENRSTPLLPPDTRRAAYVAVMQAVNSSDRSGYESLLRVYRETDLSEEKTRVLGSLASCRDPNIVLEVLNFLLSPEVRSQDALCGLSVCREGRETAWTWLKFSSFERAKEVEEFFSTRTKPTMARTLKQSIERVQINAQWVQSVQNEEHLPETVQELAHRKN
ncbi:hypothetical protein CRG98_007527 [Punica granatum]|uniref:Aminopeptidase n=1 Tax=Punica granatum TaxID=22663 RepID=A0A2I0KUR2_PUNGR|nr:hypothetical protein CRG98_007527 [Punica granatum]